LCCDICSQNIKISLHINAYHIKRMYLLSHFFCFVSSNMWETHNENGCTVPYLSPYNKMHMPLCLPWKTKITLKSSNLCTIWRAHRNSCEHHTGTHQLV
jgi:hypothetical protein